MSNNNCYFLRMYGYDNRSFDIQVVSAYNQYYSLFVSLLEQQAQDHVPKVYRTKRGVSLSLRSNY